MEEKKPGKRLAEQEGKMPSSRRGLIVTGVVFAILAAAYLGLCAYAGALDGPLPGTTVAGVSVSGLSEQQIAEKLNQEFSQREQKILLTVEGETASYHLPQGAVTVDVGQAAGEAVRLGRTGNFLTRGAGLIQGLTAGHRTEVSVQLSQEGDAEIDKMVSGIESDLGGLVQETTWNVENENLVFHMGTPGRSLDAAAVKQEILDRVSSGQDPALTLVPTVTDPAQLNLEDVHGQVFAEGKDASLNPETQEIIPSVIGVDFDVEKAKAALEGAEWGTQVSVPLTLTQPKVSTGQLQALLFRDVIGQATSKVGGTANRRSNVALAASTFNGRILLPGEVFSYNGSTGSRTAEKGYKLAPVYKGGKSVDEIGGGICQPSSTLYLATLNGNLKIMERHHHTYAVGYVPDGMDATVYYGSLDYQFENNSSYPIKLESKNYSKNGSTYLTITIYGTKEDDYTVKMTNKVYDWIEYSTIYKVDATVPKGTVKEEQNGYRGRTADTYRNIYDKDGNLVSSTLETTNKYKMRDRILLVNPADAAQYGLNADGTPLTTPVETPVPSSSVSPSPVVNPSVSPSVSPSESAMPSATLTPDPSASVLPSESPVESPSSAAETPAPSESAGGTEYGVPLLPALPEGEIA